ncbi:MAG: hypothetical protein ABII88_09785 [Candidatus Omnitrophota bacterium]
MMKNILICFCLGLLLSGCCSKYRDAVPVPLDEEMYYFDDVWNQFPETHMHSRSKQAKKINGDVIFDVIHDSFIESVKFAIEYEDKIRAGKLKAPIALVEEDYEFVHLVNDVLVENGLIDKKKLFVINSAGEESSFYISEADYKACWKESPVNLMRSNQKIHIQATIQPKFFKINGRALTIWDAESISISTIEGKPIIRK